MERANEPDPRDAVSSLRLAWTSGSGESALVGMLSERVLADDDTLAELLTADAEERWERGLDATLERYVPVVPDLVTRPEACRSLLLCELSRRDDRDAPDIAERMKSRLPDLREEIDTVVAFLASFGGADTLDPTPDVEAGQKLGKYELRESIGRGSFGEVWCAWDHDLERYVALKLIPEPPDGDVDAVLDEARTAAGLEHDSIVRVHDAGRFEDRRLVYIDTQLVGDAASGPSDAAKPRVGRSLEQAASGGEHISPRAAAEIARQVCRAVASAHARGITHGDIKPGNVLLSPAGRPMVADFGLAVLAPGSSQSDDPGRSLCIETESGRITGTPAYMSPEQARGERATPLSDVYSLGATLAALLLGRAPLQPRPGSTAPARDVIAQVRDDAVDLADLRAAHPTLGAICSMAMARDPHRRYVSADQMAEDLGAWLDHRPVRAEPVSALNRAGLWVRRNTTAVVAATIAIAILGGLSAWYVTSITTAREAATREATDYRAVLAFLTDMLESNKPSEAHGVEITLREKLDDAAAQLRESPPNSMRVAHSLNRVIGGTFVALSRFDEAEWHTTEALRLARALHDDDHAEVAEAYHRLGSLRVFQGRNAEGAEALDLAMAVHERLGGPDSVEYAIVEHERAGLHLAVGRPDLAAPMLDHAYAVLAAGLPGDDPRRILVSNTYGGLLATTGQLERAEQVLREVVASLVDALGPQNRESLVARTNHAIALGRIDRLADAEEALRAVLADSEQVLGPGHIATINSMNSLARVLDRMDRLPDAEAVYRDALARADANISETSKQTTELLNNLAMNLRMQGRADESIPIFRRSVGAHIESYGEGSPFTAMARGALAKGLIDIGEHDALREAELLLAETRAVLERVLPPGHPAMLSTLQTIARLYGPEGLDLPDRLEATQQAIDAMRP